MPSLLVALLFSASAEAQTLKTDWWHTTGGTVQAMVPSHDGSVIYMGGSFSAIGPAVTYGALLDFEEGQPTMGLPMPNNTVECSVSDGTGGWYFGGDLTEVGDQVRKGVAHINADGSLNSWQVDVEGGTVLSLLLDGSTLYMGGTFTTVGGETRSGVAAMNATTGAVLPFAPILAGAWFARSEIMLVAGQSLIMGGNFGTVNGVQRTSLASVDKVTGELTTWAPNPNYNVYSLIYSEDESTIYVGGGFGAIAGQNRAGTAAFNATTMEILPWTIPVNGPVRAMSLENGVMVIGGEFTTMGGLPRENLAAVDLTTGVVLDWIADADEEVRSVILHNGVAYVGGEFKEVGGELRNFIGAVDVTTGQVTDWDPVSGDKVYTLSLSGDKLFAGGWFTSIGGKVRHCLVAMDPLTGRATDWDAHAVNDYGSISSLCLSPDGQVLYCAGNFIDTIGGAARKHMVALDVNTGMALPWDPRPNEQVTDMKLSADGSVIYASGFFMSVDGLARRRLVAINADPQQTQLLPWNPNCSSGVVSTIALSADGTTLYVGGSFNSGSGTIGGQPRDHLAALSTTTNTNNATPWMAPLEGPTSIGSFSTSVYAILLDPSEETLYLGGFFNSAAGHTVSGEPRDHLAAVSAITGAVLPWNPGANKTVNGLKWSHAGDLMINGSFTGEQSIGGEDRQGFAYVDPSTGVVDPWSISLSYGGSIGDAEEIGDLLLLGGFFNTVNEHKRLGLAVFDGLPASITESTDSRSFQVFPNPTKDQVRLPLLPHARAVELFDIMGRSALRTNYTPIMSLQGLPAGVYILVVRDRSGMELGRARVVRE